MTDTQDASEPDGADETGEPDLSLLQQSVPDSQVAEKWAQIAPLIDRLVERADRRGEFAPRAESALIGDDKATHPYNTSHAFGQSLSAAIDHLHAAKALVHDAQMLHLGAPSTLARSAIENAATAWWLLAPRGRDERVLRTLRWFSRNYRDQHAVTDGIPAIKSNRPLEDKLDSIRQVAAKRGVSQTDAAGGYQMSTVLREHDAETDTRSRFAWQLASGFAHGRPWAYLGALKHDQQPSAEAGILNIRLTNTVQLGLYPTLTALHTVEDALLVWEQRAGIHRN